jgi:Ca2+-binding RTX toxin-like protein
LSSSGVLSTGYQDVYDGTYTLNVKVTDHAGQSAPATPITVWVGDDHNNTTPSSLATKTNTVIAFGLNGDDQITTGSGNDVLVGGNGKDVLNGGTGNDLLIGGTSKDTFAFKPNFGNDTIKNFDFNNDSVQLDKAIFGTSVSISTILTSHTHDVGGNAVIFDAAGDSITFTGVNTATLQQHQGAFHLV